MENIQQHLSGSGHFAFGFLVGYLLLLIFRKKYHDSLNIHLYLPFLPLVFGVWAALPYIWAPSTTNLPTWLNIFFFYPMIHLNEYLITYLGRPAFVALVCGSLYGLILLHYIRLAKYYSPLKTSRGKRSAR